jgi:hypothetical protein
MVQKIENNIDIKNKFIFFFNKNKVKIFSFIFILVIFSLLLVFLNINKKDKNNLISEKYSKAYLYLEANDLIKSKALLNEIVSSGNAFYSILALNVILEKELVKDKNTILNYFQTIEKIKKTTEQEDLLNLKKALYLIKILKIKQGEDILKKLINKNSELKDIAKNILAK